MNTLLVSQASEIIKSEDKLSAMCNTTALLMQSIDRINWVGFYLFKGGKLILGPFQGKVACSEIEVGKGVCGTSYQKKMLLNVADVSLFEGHIACDPDSKSELVVPLMFDGKLLGVLDCDSPELSRFSSEEESTFEEIAKLITQKLLQK